MQIVFSISLADEVAPSLLVTYADMHSGQVSSHLRNIAYTIALLA